MSKPSGGVKYAHTEAAQGSDLSGRVIYADYFDLYLEFRVSKASGGVRYAADPRPPEGQTRREGSDESITLFLYRELVRYAVGVKAILSPRPTASSV